jgi:hypothetical protein
LRGDNPDIVDAGAKADKEAENEIKGTRHHEFTSFF